MRVPGGDYSTPQYEVSGFGTNVADFVVESYFNSREIFVNTLKPINSASTYVTVATGGRVVFFDIVALATEAILVGMDEKGEISSVVNALNGGMIDTMTPKGPYGPMFTTTIKEFTKVNDE